MKRKWTGAVVWALIAVLLLTGCISPREPVLRCTVVFEDDPALYFSRQVVEVKRYESITVRIGVPKGKRIASVNYEDYSLSSEMGESESYTYYDLTLHQIAYNTVIRIDTAEAYTTAYHGPGGEQIGMQEESPHLYFNTLPYRGQFRRDGYVPIGWNTEPDGSGIPVGFGSRIDHRAQSHMDLYMQWVPESPAEDFVYALENGEAVITGYCGTGNVVIPMELDGCPVTKITAGAFGDLNTELLVLPPTLCHVAPGAFGDVTADVLFFFDSLKDLDESCFGGYAIRSVHIQAVEDPVYSGSYFDTFADKMDYLHSLQDRKKLVVLCGSSARFGYDSPMLEEKLPGYRVVNMGVYAYSNMLPQAMLVQQLMRSGDVLLSSPELDAIDTQFCGSTALDRETFCMMEANYDLFARLDCRELTNIFGAYRAYCLARENMTPRSYLESASYYDEDGVRQLTQTYNQQGDYILYRPNNDRREHFGVKRACYNVSYFTTEDIAGINRVYDGFARLGVTVLFVYSPRSSISITADSTPERIQELDEYLRRVLRAPVIGPIADSLMDPYYFYGTDNHLSTDGVSVYTAKVADYLIEYLK